MTPSATKRSKAAPAVVFAALVVATFGAFFVAQRLKHEPSVIRYFRATRLFSPHHGDARVGFTVKSADDVTLSVVDSEGDVVRQLLSTTTQRDNERVETTWNGRDDRGRILPDGLYRYRITLRREGRGIIYPRTVQVDATPPRLRVVALGTGAIPGGAVAGAQSGVKAPVILPSPDGAPARFRVVARGYDLHVYVARTAPSPGVVAQLSVPPADSGSRWSHPVEVTWDGRAGGKPAPPGTYAVVAQVRDRAGNLGRSAPVGPGGVPHAGYGRALAGRAGVTVRYAGVTPPAEAVPAGSTAVLGVDTRGRRYDWFLRRLGVSKPDRSGTRKRPEVAASGGTQRLKIPAGTPSGLYLFGAQVAGEPAARAPVAVQGEGHQPVLVVLPVMTWQGRNPVDDDGDGEPNLLGEGDSVSVQRPYAGLPPTFDSVTAPLLEWLDATNKRYDITTDVALARDAGSGLQGHRGVLIAGDARWLPASVQRALRRYVDAGGKVATVGVDSLRRLVKLNGDVLSDPTPPASFDALGLRTGPLLRGDITLTNSKDDAGLFAGTAGLFSGLTVAEPVDGVHGGQMLSSAVTPDGRTVIAAVQTGKGMTIHVGLPELPARLMGVTVGANPVAPDPAAVGLMESTWTLLAR